MFRKNLYHGLWLLCLYWQALDAQDFLYSFPSPERLDGHTNAIFSVAYSPDGVRIVSGQSCIWNGELKKQEDCVLKIWDAATGIVLYYAPL